MSNLERRIANTPEGRLGHAETNMRNQRSTEELSWGYENQARDVLSGADAVVARDEISRFADKIESSEGFERDQQLESLVTALSRRRTSFFDEIPDEPHERNAFALALVNHYRRGLH